MTSAIEARQVSKQYPGTLALNQVDFRLDPGKVMALIGENGAGKSTLVKILAGIEQPTSGTLLVSGLETVFESVRDATANGIGIIHQELNLCPNLSIADNIFLGYEMTSRGTLDRRRQHKIAHDILVRLEHPLDPETLVGNLALGQQQIVEIARALARDVKVLMMDEPTSALSATEITVLFRVIRELTARGVAIVYISHRLEELLQISDDVTVLRDGRVAGEAKACDVDSRWIVERMTGRASAAALSTGKPCDNEPILRAGSLRLNNSNGRPVLDDVSFALRKGEVLGIYGLMGAGRTELLEALMALHPDLAGSIWLDSRSLNALGTSERIAAGLAMVPEDRQTAGLIPSMSVGANMTLAGLAAFKSGPFLSSSKEEAAGGQMVTELHIKASSLGVSIQSLSGGNQQKVVIARCLLTGPRVLLLDEPTRGVDVGAKGEIHSIVRRLAAGGMGIIYVSSELEEIRAVADRILVMSRGRVTGEFAADVSGEDLTGAASRQ